MKPSIIAGHVAGAGAATTVWTAGINLPAGPMDWRLLAAGIIGPAVIAALNLAAIHHVDALDAAGAAEAARRRAASTAAQPAPTRRELVR